MVYAMFQCLIFNFISFNFLTLINHFIKVKNISISGGHFRPMMLTQRAVWSLHKRYKQEPITWALGVSEYEVPTLYLWPFSHFPVSLRGVYRHLVSLSTYPPRVEAMKEIITKEIGHFRHLVSAQNDLQFRINLAIVWGVLFHYPKLGTLYYLHFDAQRKANACEKVSIFFLRSRN